MHLSAETAFPFECSNPACDSIYDIDAFAMVYGLWGYIFMTGENKCIIGLTCPECRHTSIKQFSNVPQDFRYKQFDKILANENTEQWAASLFYVKFSTAIIPGIDDCLTEGNENDERCEIPKDFSPLSMPVELVDVPNSISVKNIDHLLEMENSQNIKVFPRIVRFNSVYYLSESWFRKISPEESLSPAYLEQCHNALSTLCSSKFSVGWGGQQKQTQKKYDHLVSNDLTEEEYQYFDQGIDAWNTEIFKTGIYDLINDYKAMRSRKDFEIACYNELINKYARRFYYRPALIHVRNFEDSLHMEETQCFNDIPEIETEPLITPDEYAVFDSDYSPQPMVAAEQEPIGNDGFQQNIQSSETPTEPIAVKEVIDRLNKKHSIVHHGGQTVVMNEYFDPSMERNCQTFSKKTDFFDRYANSRIQDPKDPTKEITEAELWWKHPDRRTYKGIVFEPEKHFLGYYNLWQGFPIKPIQGDWSLFQGHIFNIISNRDHDIYQWIMAWMARIVQDPGGQRPEKALVLRGGQGTGKSFFVKKFGALFGNHYLYLSNPKHLTGQFNNHLREALLVFVDEGFLADDKKIEGILKSLVSEERNNVEQKYRDMVAVKNHINLIVASNNDWIVPAGKDERRFFVVDLSDERKQDKKYFGALEYQMANGGIEAMMYDLMNWQSTVDLRTIPITEAQFEQKYYSMKTEEKFWFEKLNDGILLPGQNHWEEPVPFNEIYTEYKQFTDNIKDRNRISPQQLGVVLNKICKGIEKKRPTINGKREWTNIFPPLHECRRQFEVLFNMEGRIDWENDEDVSYGHFPNYFSQNQN
jgi:hypothetical protein